MLPSAWKISYNGITILKKYTEICRLIYFRKTTRDYEGSNSFIFRMSFVGFTHFGLLLCRLQGGALGVWLLFVCCSYNHTFYLLGTLNQKGE